MLSIPLMTSFPPQDVWSSPPGRYACPSSAPGEEDSLSSDVSLTALKMPNSYRRSCLAWILLHILISFSCVAAGSEDEDGHGKIGTTRWRAGYCGSDRRGRRLHTRIETAEEGGLLHDFVAQVLVGFDKIHVHVFDP